MLALMDVIEVSEGKQLSKFDTKTAALRYLDH